MLSYTSIKTQTDISNKFEKEKKLQFFPLSDEVLENFTPCNIFETRPSEDDYCEHEDGHKEEHDVFNEESPMFDKDIDDNYWLFMENPIYDISRVGSVDSKSVGSLVENPIYHMSIEKSIHS